MPRSVTSYLYSWGAISIHVQAILLYAIIIWKEARNRRIEGADTVTATRRVYLMSEITVVFKVRPVHAPLRIHTWARCTYVSRICRWNTRMYRWLISASEDILSNSHHWLLVNQFKLKMIIKLLHLSPNYKIDGKQDERLRHHSNLSRLR